MELQLFVQPLTPDALPAVLSGNVIEHSEALGLSVDLTASLAAAEGRGGREVREWDTELATALHRDLMELSNRDALDMRFWHWMCTIPFRAYVQARWASRGEEVSAVDASRYLGTPSLRGVSRNALARLLLAVRALWSTEDGYRWVEMAFENQDRFQGIFERRLGLHRPAAKACLVKLKGVPESVHREALRRLDHILTTVVVEALDQDEVEQLLDDCLSGLR